MTDLLRPEDLRKISDDQDMAKAKKAMAQMKAQEDERAGLHEIFMAKDVHPEAKARINAAVQRAAQQGERRLMALKFPASYCNDQGRRINNLDPDWPVSLEGFARKAYDYYMKELKPLGFKLHAEILDYPGGMPGDVGMFLRWDS
jgi:hypothetical protein